MGFDPLPATNYPHRSLAPKLGSLPSTGVELGDENTHDRSLGEARPLASVRPGHLAGQPVLVNGANMFAWHYCCSAFQSCCVAMER